jgi:uncharacterized protein (DUF1800 family)
MALDNALARVVAETRFGTGVTTSERSLGPQDWREFLTKQIELGDQFAPASVPAATHSDAVRTFHDTVTQRRTKALAVASSKMRPMISASDPGDASASAGEPLPHRQLFDAEVQGRIFRAIHSANALFERMASFWSNHFCVSAKKGVVRTLVGVYDREAIRPYVFGRFSDMLLAVAKHPAMLKYLDNKQSVGPNSETGRRRGTGVNENLARELLELHTLGVRGGYVQADVTAFARVLTGWSYVAMEGDDSHLGDFQFDARRHEPGPQVILGKPYKDNGVEQGEAVLRDLARHPATASHVALKLSKHFVSDDPPPNLVERLRVTFASTEGNLAEVTKTLIASDEAWEAPRQKMVPPLDFIVSSLKISGVAPGPHLVQLLSRSMGQPIWEPSSPKGFPDDSATWLSPESVKSRVDAALRIASHYQLSERVTRLADMSFGSVLSSETRGAIAAAESARQGLAIFLMSPEFQRR